MILIDSADHAGIFQQLFRFDYWLLGKINGQWTNPVFDIVFSFVRESAFWVPFYLFLLVFVVMNFKKRGGWWAVTLIMTSIISDLVSSSLIKQHIFRYRPCQDPVIGQQVRFIINYCPTSSSFTSSHACNHFAMATFMFMTMKSTSNWWRLVLVWAFIICYAQVYVGVHFPTDVISGGILGALIGYALSIFFRKQFGMLRLEQ